MRYRVRAAAFAAEPPPEDRILDADLPEVYRVSDSVRDWEALTRFTSIGFDERSDPHIGDWSGGAVGARGRCERRAGGSLGPAHV